MPSLNRVILCLLILVFFHSCVPYKNLSYFNDFETLTPITNIKEQKAIQPFDFLYIKVLSTDEKTTKIFNYSESSKSNDARAMNYMVDEKGNISFPFVGIVNLKDLTLSEAELKIQKVISDYIPNTALIVRFVENRISIMGEVSRQGEYQFIPDKISIYEALALSGGITKYGNRKKVILIRRENNKINYFKLDLSSSSIAKSKYYDILPGDILIVEPIKSLSYSYSNSFYSTLLTTVSTLATVFSLITLMYVK
ncbi:MAG: polysaccharide biosynthesis/export family protein [Bacteroidales bacterium]|nr:polysaccharide biosynthesis/export family protein [Bacteroidales bacterium]